MEPFITQKLSGWTRFSYEDCAVFRPEKQASLGGILNSGLVASYISRGLGRSYGDAAVNGQGGVISHVRLNRFLSFDAQGGVLECEAGVSFKEILQFALPRGFFLPVAPGTKFVTLGGGIAGDVHGKNHSRDGSLMNFILDLKLLTSSGDILKCSPSNHPEIFWATGGGMGLTGIILSARMRLSPVESAYMQVDYEKTDDLDQTLELFERAETHYRYSVAWLDSSSNGSSTGRAVFMCGNHATRHQIPASVIHPFAVPEKRSWNIPFTLPAFMLSQAAARIFHKWFYRQNANRANEIMDFDSFFYPLDRIHNWNLAYGRKGFIQYQIVLPTESSRSGFLELFELLNKSRRLSFLAVLKRFGQGNRGFLSFPTKGYTLALDFPVTRGLISFLQELDRLVLKFGGRVYLAKDSTLTPDVFSEMYPALSQFQEIKQRLDPAGRLSSSLSRRLKLTEDGKSPSTRK